jgi:uncharacterized protein (TIGR04552 family)
VSQENRLKRIEELSLADLESVRLILRGDSVVDWHRLDFRDEAEARRFLHAQELRPEDPVDQARLESIKNEAIEYLRRNFDFAIPRPVERASVIELLLLASGKGHRQVCACTVLKAMHIIHHLDGRELMFVMPMSSQDLFQLVEERVYRVIGGMLASGMPITEFIGGRKSKDSLYSKLLSKSETSAAAIYDKIRFRIVTREPADLIPVLSYLTEHLIPFNYVVPGQSINTIFHFRSYCEGIPHLAEMIPHFQGKLDDQFTPSDNRFSASSYRVMHFVADLPVRLPPSMMEKAPPSAWSLGSIVFALVEFQLIDRATELANEVGDASHASYKERQRQAVSRRLKLGLREMRVPPSATTAAATKHSAIAGAVAPAAGHSPGRKAPPK